MNVVIIIAFIIKKDTIDVHHCLTIAETHRVKFLVELWCWQTVQDKLRATDRIYFSSSERSRQANSDQYSTAMYHQAGTLCEYFVLYLTLGLTVRLLVSQK